jgi:hypothetical protein
VGSLPLVLVLVPPLQSVERFLGLARSLDLIQLRTDQSSDLESSPILGGTAKRPDVVVVNDLQWPSHSALLASKNTVSVRPARIDLQAQKLM